ncbi:hypothetical protein BpHYR1_014201 [Brachionus plicatilis]|uniref:Uncharacterized protein n=1 Tax=Brachionus plicatilis TaxID=10195 RepID=A0A3M7SA43_BRAPC|nr:hypothetical protein BpHYR1_014201 [Brachionus plicatilis]
MNGTAMPLLDIVGNYNAFSFDIFLNLNFSNNSQLNKSFLITKSNKNLYQISLFKPYSFYFDSLKKKKDIK